MPYAGGDCRSARLEGAKCPCSRSPRRSIGAVRQSFAGPGTIRSARPLISFEGVHQAFLGRPSRSDDVTLSIYENEFFCLLGPVGLRPRSTLMRMLAGLRGSPQRRPASASVGRESRRRPALTGGRCEHDVSQSYAAVPAHERWRRTSPSGSSRRACPGRDPRRAFAEMLELVGR